VYYAIAALIVVGAALLSQLDLSTLIAITQSTSTQIPAFYARNYPESKRTIWAPFDSNAVDIMENCCQWISKKTIKNATLIWLLEEDDIDDRKIELGKGQIMNLLQGTQTLTNKANLHRLLYKINRTDLQPETYILGADKRECEEFFISAMNHPDFIWISKIPTSARGIGIVVNPDINELREQYLIEPTATKPSEIRCKTPSDDESEVIIQKYILNPLLLKGKKNGNSYLLDDRVCFSFSSFVPRRYS